MHTRFKNLGFVAAFLSLMAIAIPSAHAQKNEPPSGQFGIGIYASTWYTSGLEGVYAINQNIQVGSLLALGVTSISGYNSTNFLLAPYFRYLFSSSVSPFVQGGIVIWDVRGSTNPGIFLGGGLAYYLNHDIGVHAEVDLINVLFSNPTLSSFGWSAIRGGAEWFF